MPFPPATKIPNSFATSSPEARTSSTCATLLGERVSDRVIAAILGHTPGTVTARYAKVTLPQMREALEALYQELTRADTA